VPLSTQVYKWVLANLMLGVTLRWTSIPSRGSRSTPSCFMLQKSKISASLISRLARIRTSPLPLQQFPFLEGKCLKTENITDGDSEQTNLWSFGGCCVLSKALHQIT